MHRFEVLSLKAIILLPLLFAISGCSLFTTAGEFAWSRTQARPVIEITDCCGFVPQLVPLNYIPDAQIWGDGRFVWIRELRDGAREVLQTTLSEEQIKDYLERLIQAGFFQWRDEYADLSVTDIAWQCINVELIGKSKSVCEYFRGAPVAFHELYDDLAAGLGQSGTDYVPERGYLTAFQLEGIGFSSTPLTLWDEASTGLDLRDAERGIWVEGAALLRAWEIVNDNTYSNMVESNGRVYQLAVQIPGLSMLDPEER